MKRPQHRSTRSTSRRRAAVSATLVGAALLGGLGAAGCGTGPARTTHAAQAAAPATTPTTAPPPPLTVTGTTPAAGTTLTSSTEPLQVTFSSAPADGAPSPSLSPATPGTWARQGATMTFTPTAGYAPYTPLHVVVPAGLGAAGGGSVAAAVTLTWQPPAPTTRRVQQLLAAAGYLPVAFTPAAGAPVDPSGVADQPGAFSWRWAATPASLQAAWSEGQPNLVTQGAVMAFEADHGLTVDGLAGPSVWAALTAAVGAGHSDPRPYDYISVSMGRPETLSVWQAGQVVYTTLANTGVPGAPTAPGTFPVFERFPVTTMRGTNPDGTKYVDPGIPWVAYFHGGDAIHGFVRPGYGYPQSDGCVELPPDHAQAVYPMDFYGTLVTVS